MSNPTWPAGLPTPLINAATYSTPVEPTIRTAMEVGAPKSRRRFTAVPEAFGGRLILKGSQWQALQHFHDVTLGCVGPFDWLDFRTGESCTYTFVNRPTAEVVEGSKTHWRVTISLLTVP